MGSINVKRQNKRSGALVRANRKSSVSPNRTHQRFDFRALVRFLGRLLPSAGVKVLGKKSENKFLDKQRCNKMQRDAKRRRTLLHQCLRGIDSALCNLFQINHMMFIFGRARGKKTHAAANNVGKGIPQTRGANRVRNRAVSGDRVCEIRPEGSLRKRRRLHRHGRMDHQAAPAEAKR